MSSGKDNGRIVCSDSSGVDCLFHISHRIGSARIGEPNRTANVKRSRSHSLDSATPSIQAPPVTPDALSVQSPQKIFKSLAIDVHVNLFKRRDAALA